MARIYVVTSQDSEKVNLPTKVSELENDLNFISEEVDPHLKISQDGDNKLVEKSDGLYVKSNSAIIDKETMILNIN